MKVSYVDLPAQFRSNENAIMESVVNVLKSGSYILDNEVKKFEESFKKISGANFAIGVANGTDALIIALKALGIKEGDEVITVSNSWVSSVSSIALCGAVPVMVDVRDDFNIDPSLIEKAISRKTKAIIPVHLTGKSADMDPILEIARKHGLYVIEDSAQAVGTIYKGKKCGSMGDVACFSLHPLKNLNAIGDAGMITTNRQDLAEKINLYRNHGLVGRNEVRFFGFNSRLDEIQAAILNTKIADLDKVIEKRRLHAKIYRDNISQIVSCPGDQSGCVDSYHLFMIQCDRRDELKVFLENHEVFTAIHYPTPVHLQPAAGYLGYGMGSLPVTEKQAKRILSLPVHHMLDSSQIEFVCNRIKEFYTN